MTNLEFSRQLETIQNVLFSFALRLTKNHEDAQDLMQETSMRAYRHREKFTLGTNFKGWMSTIMRNTFINRYRKEKNRKTVSQPVENFTFAIENKNVISNQGEMNLRIKELHHLLNKLGELYSIPFLMFYRGYEYKEIAQHLEIPIGTVKSRIFQARAMLKEMIGERYTT